MSDKYFAEDKVIGKCYKCQTDVSERGSVEVTQPGKDAKRMCLDCYRSSLKHHVTMGIVWAVIGALAGVAGGFIAVLAFAYAGWSLYYGATASFWSARFWRKASSAGSAPQNSWGGIGLNFLKVGVYLVSSLCYGIFGGAISQCLHDARELKTLSAIGSQQSPAEDETRLQSAKAMADVSTSSDDKQTQDNSPLGAVTDAQIEVDPDPTDADAWFSKGVRLGSSEEAIACFDKAIELDPTERTAWYNKGVIFSDLGRYEEAIACFDKAIELDPAFGAAWAAKGNTFGILARYDEGIDCYDRALELDPRDCQTQFNKALAEDTLRRPQDAARSYQQFLDLNPPEEGAEQIDIARRRVRELDVE